MEPLTFRHQQRVTYSHCTIGNHVYHSRYLDLLEAARGEFLRSLGRPLAVLQGEGLAFPVIECRLRYLEPARYDEVVTTELWLTLARGVRLNVSYQLLNEAGVIIYQSNAQAAAFCCELLK